MQLYLQPLMSPPDSGGLSQSDRVPVIFYARSEVPTCREWLMAPVWFQHDFRAVINYPLQQRNMKVDVQEATSVIVLISVMPH